MTAPHRYIRNQFVKISRGTLNQAPLILADAEGSLQAELRYIFARAAEEFDIQILALTIEPCGYEAVIFDPDMRRSDFFKSVNQSVSLAVKRRTEHRESLWSNKKPGNVPILDLETLKSEIVQVCMSPVREGYVREISDWELPTIGPASWGKETLCPHPDAPEDFVAKECPGLKNLEENRVKVIQKSPTEMEIRSAYEHANTVMATKDELVKRIKALEGEERKKRKRVLGKRASRIGKNFMKSKYRRPWKYMDHRKTVLCTCSMRLKRVKNELKRFFFEYHNSLISFIKSGGLIFPVGTVKMRVLFRASLSGKIEDDDPFHFTV